MFSVESFGQRVLKKPVTIKIILFGNQKRGKLV